MGLIGGLLFGLFNAIPVHMLSPRAFRTNPFAWLKTISDVAATCTPAPPSAYAIAARMAPRAVEAGLDLSSLECAMVGAERIPPPVLRAFASAFAPCGFRAEAFFPVYGLTEATVAVTFPRLLAPTRFDRVDRAALEREGRAVPCPDGPTAIELTGVGRPLPRTELRIVRDGARAAEREMGEIRVRSPSLMDGYHGEPEATAEVLQDGWLKTGDVGYVAGGDLFVTGRTKDVVIKGGHNLLPGPIEEIAGGVEGVRPGCVAAVGVASAQRATELLYVVAETAGEPAEPAAPERRVREALAAHGIAADRVLLVPAGMLPRTTSARSAGARSRASSSSTAPDQAAAAAEAARASRSASSPRACSQSAISRARPAGSTASQTAIACASDGAWGRTSSSGASSVPPRNATGRSRLGWASARRRATRSPTMHGVGASDAASASRTGRASRSASATGRGAAVARASASTRAPSPLRRRQNGVPACRRCSA